MMLTTYCPYDDDPFAVTYTAENEPASFDGACMHAPLAQYWLEMGGWSEVTRMMPVLAAHLAALQPQEQKI
jgi:hypothetical protein